MKKILSVILSIILMLSIVSTGLFSVVANATTYTDVSDNITYITIYSSSHEPYAYVSNCNTSANGYQSIKSWSPSYADVTSISASAFSGCTGITGVGIPSTITAIGSFAFSGCTSLASISLPNGLTSINGSIFYNCVSLESVSVPGNVTSIGESAFYNCRSLKSISIPSGVKAIKSKTFFGCSSLTSITIPEGVTSIEDSAFSGCTNLISIVIPSSVKSIGANAFSGCSNLKVVNYAGNWFMIDSISIQSGNNDLTNAGWSCQGCLEEEHTFDSVCDTQCNNCGFPRNAHVYSNSCDTECDLCGNIRTISHTYTDNSDAICDVCDFQRFYISYDLNGGSVGPENIWSETTRLQISKIIPTKKGYLFVCWRTTGGDSVKCQPGDTLTITDNTSLKAMWVENCSNCYGEGIEDYLEQCNKCYGKGTVLSDTVCSTCGGDGRYEASVNVTCTACNGTGDKSSTCGFCGGYGGYFTYKCSSGHSMMSKYRLYTCSTCGSSSISETIHKCNTCGGYGTVDYCTTCGGDGKTTKQETKKCNLCSGVGYKRIDCSSCEAGNITKTRTCSSCNGSCIQTPSAPTIYSVTTNVVILNTIDNGEYSIGGTIWQDSPVFDNLEPGREYTFYQRYAQTNHTLQSNSSVGLTMTTHQHMYDNACDSECNTCGLTRITGNHVYDTDCDTACNVCGYVRTVGDHVYDNTCDTTCNVCGFVLDGAGHLFDNGCDTICNTCGQSRITTHQYEWVVDEGGNCGENGIKHEECAVCHITRSVGTIIEATGNHTYDNVCDPTCNICGFIRSGAKHAYDNACDAICDCCGEERTTGGHVFDDKDDNYCNICNYYWLLKYQINSDCTVTIIDLDNSYSGKFEIPKTINGYPVTEIEDKAFSNCTGLTSITIPDSIVRIGYNAFGECDGLTEVHISNMSAWCNIKFSDDYSNPAFCGYSQCYSRKLYLNGSLVTDIKIPNGVTTIGDYAFYGYSELESVEIPDSVKSIGYGTFYRCTKLESIVIPDSVTTIGANTFRGCKNLIKVTLPDKLTRIEDGLFAECSDLISFKFPSNLKSIGSSAFAQCDSLVTVKIPKGVTEIDQNAFECCRNLRTVVLPEGITEISCYTFRSCQKLESITIPKSLKKVDDEAFLYTFVEKVYISDLAAWCNIEFASDNVSESPLSNCADIYLNNKRLVNVVVPKQVTSIRSHAFYGCQNIKSVTLHDNITSIGDSAFKFCTKLKSIILPDSIKKIGDCAFAYCYNLKKNAIPKNITVVGGGTFSESGVKVLYIPKTTEFIKADAFTYRYDACGLPESGVEYIYYGGSKSDKKNLTIFPGNDALAEAKWIYKAGGLPECIYDNTCDTTCNMCGTTRTVTHSYKTTTVKATLSKNGKIVNKCSICGATKTTTIYYPKTIKLPATKYTYNGKVQTPSVNIKDSKGNTLKKGTDYTVKYSGGRKNTGKYAVAITFKGKYSGTKTLYFNILPSKTSKITPICGTTSIKASWKGVTGATGYKVQLLNSKGKVVKSITTTKTAYTFSSLGKVTTYKIKVTAYKVIDKKKVYSKSSTIVTTSTAPAAATISKVTAGSNQVTVIWETVSDASGYEVMYSTSSKFKSAKTANISKRSTTNTTIKQLTKGKTYYFKVRPYKTVDGKKVYGEWSTVRNTKVK